MNVGLQQEYGVLSLFGNAVARFKATVDLPSPGKGLVIRRVFRFFDACKLLRRIWTNLNLSAPALRGSVYTTMRLSGATGLISVGTGG